MMTPRLNIYFNVLFSGLVKKEKFKVAVNRKYKEVSSFVGNPVCLPNRGVGDFYISPYISYFLQVFSR